MRADILYALGLFASVTAALVVARRVHAGRVIAAPVTRSVLAILLNWIAGIAFNHVTGVTDGWIFNFVIDTLSAIAVLYRPAGRWQAVLGVLFCAQIAMDAGYGLLRALHVEADADKYYWALTRVAWLQLLLVWGWCGGLVAGGADRDVRVFGRQDIAGTLGGDLADTR